MLKFFFLKEDLVYNNTIPKLKNYFHSSVWNIYFDKQMQRNLFHFTHINYMIQE